ncbi:MAG: peptidoglycan DD-metalloendopeptidase family protein [Deltaproteobacteria bacterium]|nr:peptidoglycan DD-metalloendopeptidase family protein [Deltaproteobacteria bacterium]
MNLRRIGIILKGWFLVTAALCIMASRISAAPRGPELKVFLSPDRIPQGGLGLLRIKEMEFGVAPEVLWRGNIVTLVPDPEKGEWVGFIGVDLGADPGEYTLRVVEADRKRLLKVVVASKDYGVRRLTLPKKMVELDPQTLERVKKETRVMRRIWSAPPSEPLWRGGFVRPVPGKVVGPFGKRSILNGRPRSPHSGVDFRGALGTPVRAANHGRVVLTAEHFFSGRSVVIDHGGGILSMYFHLRDITVGETDFVHKGEVIGHVGSTGRATGPHLHWGVRVGGARVDPLLLLKLGRELEE